LPEKIGKYVIINEVGRGSTGVVYLSHDPYYGRDVAIKVYNVDASGDENRKRIARKMSLRGAHGRHAAASEHSADLRRRRRERTLLHRYRACARRPFGRLLRPDNLLRIDDVVELVYKAARALH
jgi:serine/threonine protein kinase